MWEETNEKKETCEKEWKQSRKKVRIKGENNNALFKEVYNIHFYRYLYPSISLSFFLSVDILYVYKNINWTGE